MPHYQLRSYQPLEQIVRYHSNREALYCKPIYPQTPQASKYHGDTENRYSPISTAQAYSPSEPSAAIIPIIQPEYEFSPQIFLSPHRAITPMISCDVQIKALMETAFMKTTNHPFPDNISVHICNREEIDTMHPSPFRTLGIAVNRYPYVSEILVTEAPLDELMLTLGHEIGHVLSPRRSDIVHEEAKAFAFSFWWMETIRENNIGGLGQAIPKIFPAPNGIHDKAHLFVHEQHMLGKSFEQIFVELAN